MSAQKSYTITNKNREVQLRREGFTKREIAQMSKLTNHTLNTWIYRDFRIARYGIRKSLQYRVFDVFKLLRQFIEYQKAHGTEYTTL